jgi:competence protein ComEC
VLGVFSQHGKRENDMRRSRAAKWAVLASMCITVLRIGNVATAGEAAPGRAAPALEIYFIDVLGGAATLLVPAEGETVLIDSGWPGFENRDPKRIVHVLKDVAGRDRLDHLVTTHWHTDHFGGVGGLAKMVEIAHFWDRGLPDDKDPEIKFPEGVRSQDPLLIAYRAASAGKRQLLRAGDALPLKGLKAVVLASGGRVIDQAAAARARGDERSLPSNPLCQTAPPDQPADGSDNACSLVLLFSLGKFQFFDAGDLTWNVEKQLVCPVDLIGPVDLYQVTHHGMDISNHPTLVQTIAPSVAITNNGPRKGGAAATYRLLKSVPSIQAIFQLHRNAATGDDDNTEPSLIANRDAAGGQFIRVQLDASGAKFTVQIGEQGVKREFECK